MSFLTDVSTEMAMGVLPMFLTVTLGASVAFVGLIEGVAETTACLLKVLSGWWSDRSGRRKVLVVAGYSLSTATRPLLAMAGAAWQVLGARFVDRVGKGLRTSPRDALLAAAVAPEIRGFAFGFHRAMDHAGAIVGPLLAFAFLRFAAADYRTILWVAVVPGLLTIPLLIFGIREPQPERPDATPLPLKTWRPDRTYARYLGVVFLFTLANSSDAFLLLRAKSLGVPDAQIPLLFAVLHVSKMLSSVPGSALSDRFSRKTLILSGWLLYAAVYLGFACATTPLHLWALFLVYGFFFGLTEGTERAWVADLVPPEARGRAYGWFHFAVGIGTLPASLLFGLLWKEFSAGVAFTFGSTVALAAATTLGALVTSRPRLPDS